MQIQKLTEKVTKAIATTGPAALEVLLVEMAERIEALEAEIAPFAAHEAIGTSQAAQ